MWVSIWWQACLHAMHACASAKVSLVAQGTCAGHRAAREKAHQVHAAADTARARPRRTACPHLEAAWLGRLPQRLQHLEEGCALGVGDDAVAALARLQPQALHGRGGIRHQRLAPGALMHPQQLPYTQPRLSQWQAWLAE